MPTHVVIGSQGPYASVIGDYAEYFDEGTFEYIGWQYTLNAADPGYAASICELDNNDTVKWEFKPYAY